MWIAPYYEDDVSLLAQTIGVDKILFGSDWPHGEGLEDPMTFLHDIPQFPEFSPEDVRKVMRDNVSGASRRECQGRLGTSRQL